MPEVGGISVAERARAREVLNQLRLLRFSADRATITPGEQVILSWEISEPPPDTIAFFSAVLQVGDRVVELPQFAGQVSVAPSTTSDCFVEVIATLWPSLAAVGRDLVEPERLRRRLPNHLIVTTGMSVGAGGATGGSAGDPAGVEGTPSAVRDDLLVVTKPPHWENSLSIAPPDPAGAQGRLVIVTGGYPGSERSPQFPDVTEGPGDQPRIFTRGYNALDHTLDAAEVEHALPTIAGMMAGTDNQIVRLVDGSLLVVKGAAFWRSFSVDAPPWATEIIGLNNMGVPRVGLRGGELFFRSVDGGQSWLLRSWIDYGEVLGRAFGAPRPSRLKAPDPGRYPHDLVRPIDADVCVDHQDTWPNSGGRMWWQGGGDRQELYACPFTGNVYMTTTVIRGPYDGIDFRAGSLLWMSSDLGRTWTNIAPPREAGDLWPWGEPTVITSTPDGRLFVLMLVNSVPTIYCSLDPVTKSVFKDPKSPGGSPPAMSGPHSVLFADDSGTAPYGTELPGQNQRIIQGQQTGISIARVGTDGQASTIRVAYPTPNPYGHQDICVVNVSVTGGADPTVTARSVIRFSPGDDRFDPDRSLLFPHFVQAEMAPPDYTGHSMLFWIDANATTSAEWEGTPPLRCRTKFSVFSGEFGFTTPGFLSMRGGDPTWTSAEQGDYTTGCSFWTPGLGLRFLGMWVEEDGIHVNTVAVRTRFRPDPNSTPD